MLKSKLKNTYPTADPAQWLIGNWQSLDPVFAGRLAYYAMKTGKKMKLNECKRSTALQTVYYNEYLQYKRTGRLGSHGIKLAAAPGTSYHEISLAADADKSHPIYNVPSASLAAYGLCKPLVNKGEFWHVQPIETLNLGANASIPAVKALAPAEIEESEDDMKVYENINELTGDWKDAVQWALDKKIIQGNGKTMGLRESEVKALVFQYRDNKRKGTL
jgi:hypothetical protein